MANVVPSVAAALRRTPDVLDALVGRVEEDWARHAPGPGEWAAADVLGHFIHGERTDWIPRARIIMEHGRGRPFDPFDRTGHEKEVAGRTVGDLLATFRQLREDNVAVLTGWSLTEADLDREGTHPAFGPVTLRQLLTTWATHDHVHLAQVAQALAVRYREAVGPWQEYLWE
jgi:hypothetical protein